MGESISHIILVSLLAQWIASTLLDGDQGHVLIDAPDRDSRGKPPKVYEFVPDVYVMNAPHYGLIIGEAKIAEDLENKHTVEQINAFLRKCTEFEKSILVLAVPWHTVRLAEAIVKDCKRKIKAEKVETIILEKLPG
jgi:hypothetical protein